MNEEKFSGKAGFYADFRPGYPQKLFDYLKAAAGLTAGKTVADIGSGTGLFTRQLLGAGCKVFAVEPNEDMRKSAEEQLRGCARFCSVDGSAEHTTLGEGCADLVTVAQAFHWFDMPKFRAECKRILKSGGRVILVWNHREEECALVRENAEINRRFCPSFKGFSQGLTKDDEAISAFFGGKFERTNFEHALQYDEAQFIGRNLSSSYALRQTDAGFGEYAAELKKLFARYAEDGRLQMPNYTACYLGTIS